MRELIGGVPGTVTTTVKPFILGATVTRPNDITTYSIGDIINTATDATGLVALDFTTLRLVPNQIVQISKVLIASSNGAATTQLSPIIQLFNQNFADADTVTGETIGVGDNLLFKPLATKVLASDKCMLTFNNVSEPVNISTQNVATGFYGLKQTGIDDKIKLSSDGKLYMALICNNAYQPIANEQFKIKLEGFGL